MKHKHHIIPRHMGGTDDPENIIELTIEEHAEAHRILYETYGHWQDYVAWQGLAKLSSKEEHIHMLLSESGKKGAAIRIASGGNTGMKYNMSGKYSKTGKPRDRSGENNPCAKSYEVTYPNGDVKVIKSLKTWCESNNLKYNSFHNAIKHGRTFKGYTAKKVT